MRRIKNNKKGISDIIVTVILIGIVLSLGVVVWQVVNNLVQGKIKNTQSCFGNFGKISINTEFTCYNKTANPKEFSFSISRADIDVDSIIVSISSQSGIKSYKIPGNYTNVKMYGGAYNDQLTLPGKNGGVTYITKDFETSPTIVKIAPIINGQQCDPADTLSAIENC